MPMETYVKNRGDQAGTPPNGSGPVNPSRQAIAANARVQVTRPAVSRAPIAQNELPHRGESVTQQQSVLLPQHPQRWPSGEGGKRDLYDTDAESLNSTTNHSAIKVENSPRIDHHQLQLNNEEAEAGGNGEASSEFEYDGEEYQFDEAMKNYLEQNGKGNASYDERLQFMQDTQPHLFATLEGDSYPTTTDGNPTEWGENQAAYFEELGSSSSSPQRFSQPDPSPALFNQQPLQQESVSNLLHTNSTGLQGSKIYKKGEQIRGQQRTDGARGQQGQQHDIVYPPTSRLPTYSQANRAQGFATATHARQEVILQAGQTGFSQQAPDLPSGRGQSGNSLPTITRPTGPSKHASKIRTKVVPTIQHHTERIPVEEPMLSPNDDDYESEILFKLGYEQLRDESFDKDPRAREPVLTADMLEKPLVERLQFVYSKLDPAAQAEFFGALPTNEWEDAGDWFLDQFSAIIKSTKEARQKKRKAAQDLEREIDKRHTHVEKKQKIVQGAMIKMKTQGEGLVPKSPGASKSPRPKRG